MAHILIIEDDIALSQGLCLALKEHTITQAFTVAQGEALLTSHCFDLVILDINLPDGSGLDVLKSSAIPTILLTANDLEQDIVRGLELGAEDYITKPFSLPVLRARVQTQLRKLSPVYQQGAYSFDFQKGQFTREGQGIDLSKPEQRLLKTLIRNKNQTVLRDTLIDHIWGDSLDSVEENALSVTANRLRRKLGGDCIKTVYGLGYQWRDEG